MKIKDYIKEAHDTAVSKGWWEGEEIVLTKADDHNNEVAVLVPRSFGDQIALMHSELSEALEEFRKGEKFDDMYGTDPVYKTRMGINTMTKPEGIAVELADVLIRIFDTCGRYNIPLEEALRLKLDYNKTRPHRHGGKKL